jgi:2-(1,2-epoxy-1,2-dihydrophenyl)acetyl-CoA isomerase
MTYQHVLFETADGVATITLNRPDVLNSFNMAMAADLQHALRVVGEDDAVRAVLLTGAGRAFCAGQDLAEAAPSDGSPAPNVGDIVRRTYNPTVRAIRALEKPVVCAVNGVAAGAGANLALSCDVVLAADNASFVQAFSKIGLIPDTGGTFFLPRLVGLARALEIAAFDEPISADQALAWGLVTKVVDAPVLLDEAMQMARAIARRSLHSFGWSKSLLTNSFDTAWETQLEHERQGIVSCAAHPDGQEGMRAFLEKREPRYNQ